MLRMMRWGLGLLGLAAAGVIAVSAVGIGGGASAQTPPEDDDKSAIEVHGDRYRELLAEELGISVDELTTAQKSARDRLLDEKVSEGKLTEEQAERLKSREIGEGRPLGFWLGFGMRGKLHSAVVEVFKVASDVLGIDVEELRDRIAGGESLTEIAESQGMDEEALKTELVGALTDRINQAVTDGDIDQELADRLLEHLDEMVDRAIDREGPFHHMDFEGPRSPRFESFMN